MKVQINNDDLLRALSRIQSIVEKRNASSILSNVKISTKKNQISFYTTDLDIFTKETMKAGVGGELSTTVSMHVFYDVIRKIGNDKEIQLIFEPSDNPMKMLIKTAISEFTLPCLSAEEFPDFEEGKYDCEFSISAVDLYYLVSITKHAISYDDNRYYLSGMFFHATKENAVNVLRSVATDAHRLAMAEVTLPQNAYLFPEIIIPRKTAFELVKLLEGCQGEQIPIGVSPNKIAIKVGNTTFVSKLIDGKFPDYNKAVPYENSMLLEVSVEELAQAIDLVTAISTEKIKAVKLKLQKNKIVLFVSDKINSFGMIEIPAIYDDDEVSIAFNAKYILDILSNITGKKVRFKVNSNNTAVLVEDTANYNCRFVLMPMQM